MALQAWTLDDVWAQDGGGRIGVQTGDSSVLDDELRKIPISNNAVGVSSVIEWRLS